MKIMDDILTNLVNFAMALLIPCLKHKNVNKMIDIFISLFVFFAMPRPGIELLALCHGRVES